VTLDREIEIGGAHPAAIIGDADQAASASLNGNLNAGGTRIQRIFDQFFDGGGWTLDDFARRDAVNQQGIETADGHGALYERLGSALILSAIHFRLLENGLSSVIRGLDPRIQASTPADAWMTGLIPGHDAAERQLL